MVPVCAPLSYACVHQLVTNDCRSSIELTLSGVPVCTYMYMMKRLRNIFRELRKTGSHPGLNRRPLS